MGIPFQPMKCKDDRRPQNGVLKWRKRVCGHGDRSLELESIISFYNFMTNILDYPDYSICCWIVFVHHVHLESAWNQNWPYWMIFLNDSSVHVILKKNNGLSSKYKYNNLLSFWNDFPLQSTSPLFFSAWVSQTSQFIYKISTFFSLNIDFHSEICQFKQVK